MRKILGLTTALVMLTSCEQIQSVDSPYNIQNPGTNGIPVRGIKALECDFTVNHSATIGKIYDSGKSGEKMEITFASLDFKTMKGQMIGNAGASEITLELSELMSGTQLHLYEKTMFGNINFTTVFFFQDPKNEEEAGLMVLDRQAFAVHSRHSLIGDKAVIAQLSGPCTIKF